MINGVQTVTVSNCPVDYMTCDAKAFEVGDRVIVVLPPANGGLPTVIGFVDNPRKCPSAAASYSYWDFEAKFQLDEEWDGVNTWSCYAAFYITLTEDYCDGYGLTYPYKIAEYPRTYMGVLDGGPKYLTNFQFSRSNTYYDTGEWSSTNYPGSMHLLFNYKAGYLIGGGVIDWVIDNQIELILPLSGHFTDTSGTVNTFVGCNNNYPFSNNIFKIEVSRFIVGGYASR